MHLFSILAFLIFPASACKLTFWAWVHQLCFTDIWGPGNVGRCSNLLWKSRTAWEGKKNCFLQMAVLQWDLKYERLSDLTCQFTDDMHFYRGIVRKVHLGHGMCRSVMTCECYNGGFGRMTTWSRNGWIRNNLGKKKTVKSNTLKNLPRKLLVYVQREDCESDFWKY